MSQKLASWEGYARSILRIILGFLISLHGYRVIFGMFPVQGGRRGVPGMALDTLPHFIGYVEILGGALLFLGLFTQITAAVFALEMLAGYFLAAAPRGAWPIRNGGEEVVIYFFVFLCFALAGAGSWSLDELIWKRKAVPAGSGYRAANPARS